MKSDPISVFAECVLHVEHGWLCIRNRAGWLLWSEKMSKSEMHRGIVLADLAAKLAAQQAEWECYQSEDMT